MAPCTIANLKLSQYLKGICNVNFENENIKLGIFLTNTLDITMSLDQESFFKAFSLL